RFWMASRRYSSSDCANRSLRSESASSISDGRGAPSASPSARAHGVSASKISSAASAMDKVLFISKPPPISHFPSLRRMNGRKYPEKRLIFHEFGFGLPNAGHNGIAHAERQHVRRKYPCWIVFPSSSP